MASLQSVHSVYQSVVEDVISGVREAFLDEGMDEQVLQELKQLWESKLTQSKAVELPATQGVAASASQHSMPSQSFAPYPTGGLKMGAHKQTIPAAHSGSVAAPTPSQIPPMAHQNSQPLNLQGVLAAQGITTTLSPAAQTAVLSYQNMAASSQARIATLPIGQQVTLANGQQVTIANGQQVTLSNGQVLQIVPSQVPGQQQLLFAAKTEPKPETSSQAAVVQLDGVGDSSSDDDDDVDAADDDEDDEDDDVNDEAPGEEEEPLNSDDDVSDADPIEVFDAENVVVCQFDKINRSKNKWKFHLKDGIMNLNGKDFVFQKATGDAEW